MNRLELQFEETAPLRSRYTTWVRMGTQFAHVSNWCTLAAALRAAQKMEPRGYITTLGNRP